MAASTASIGLCSMAVAHLGAQVSAPRTAGAVLPKAYYDRLERNPRAFTLPNGLFGVDASGARVIRSAVGAKRILVIPGLFSDSPDPPVTSQQIQQILFTGPAPKGTLTDAYLEMSQGKLEVDGDVASWVRTSLTLQQVVGTSQGLGEDAMVGQYLTEALALEDSTVDFGLYDNDGPDGIPNSGDDDGFVDAVSFEFVEVAGSCGGPGIWPHMFGISGWPPNQPYVTNDIRPGGGHIQVDAYIVESAMDCSGTEIQSAATIAHEFGHVLGLPDFYHPTVGNVGAEGRRWVLGCWELMAAGSWGCGPVGSERAAFGPTHMSAYPKHTLGWVNYVDVGDVRNKVYELAPMETTGRPLRIALDSVGREYLLVEYRTHTGFDVDLPATGVLVYHQDTEGSLRPTPGSGQPYFLSVVEQDHNNGLQRNSFEGGNRGEAGDAWGVGGVAQRLDYLTTPSLRRDDGSATSVTIHSVSAEGDRALVRLSTARTPVIVEPTDTVPVTEVEPFERHFRIAGGYMPYTADGAAPDGVTLTVDNDELVASGSIQGTGPFDVALRVVDGRGSESPVLFYSLTATEWLVGEDRLVQPFLLSDAQPLTSPERLYLDASGNGNGQYDVGDLRAWLRAHPGASSAAGRR
ncbi:MAG: M6 family metalloprotease domain-containing protein [Gemmatimonadetes bacterium]|nr:M6 family metalloprotease domain-containing protein [Gemmatimonadota bacterium]